MIANESQLISHGLAALRTAVLDVAEAGLRACDPAEALERRMALRGRTLVVDNREYELDGRGVLLVGAGKASLRLAQVIEQRIGPCIDGGVIIVPTGGAAPLQHVECIEANHPLPDDRSAAAAESFERLQTYAASKCTLASPRKSLCAGIVLLRPLVMVSMMVGNEPP